MPVEIEYEVKGDIVAKEHIPAFINNELTAAPHRLHARYYGTGENGGITLFAGEAKDEYVAAIVRGKSILVDNS